jgi:hypothetical protein
LKYLCKRYKGNMKTEKNKSKKKKKRKGFGPCSPSRSKIQRPNLKIQTVTPFPLFLSPTSLPHLSASSSPPDSLFLSSFGNYQRLLPPVMPPPLKTLSNQAPTPPLPSPSGIRTRDVAIGEEFLAGICVFRCRKSSVMMRWSSLHSLSYFPLFLSLVRSL